jgi:hypothetical protein
MKTASLSIGSSSLELYASFGVSAEAKTVASMFSDLDGERPESVSLGQDKSDALQNLYNAFCEACRPGWDGYSALSANFESYVKAESFIRALPSNIPTPEVALDPDGEVSLEWYRAPRRVFSVSIGPDDELTYAGIFGSSKTRGVETFNFEFPKVVLDNLRRLLS